MNDILRFRTQAWPELPPPVLEQTLPGFLGRNAALSLQDHLGQRGQNAWVRPEAWGWRVGASRGDHLEVYQTQTVPGTSDVALRFLASASPSLKAEVETWAKSLATQVEWQSL